MSYSLLFRELFERKQKGQPHYIRKWCIKNAKPTGLTDAQRAIAAPPDGGEPAAAIYAFLDISQYKPDWEPKVLQIIKRPELGTEYAELDNGFWYLLEKDGGFKHMTHKEFTDFLVWKSHQDQLEEDDDATEEEWDEDEEELLAEFEAAGEVPDPSLEMLNSEIEEIDSEMEEIDAELEDSD